MSNRVKILNEIGYGTAKRYPVKVVGGNYSLNRNGDVVTVEFVTEGMQTYVAIFARHNDYLLASFRTKAGDYNTLTGDGNVFRIMATMLVLVKTIFSKTLREFNGIVYRIDRNAVGKKDRQRIMLYKAFIRKFAEQNSFDVMYNDNDRLGYRYATFFSQFN